MRQHLAPFVSRFLSRFAPRRGVGAASGLAAAIALGGVGQPWATASAASDPLGCTVVTFPTQECADPCTAFPHAIAATEVDGVRHMMWVQTQPGTSFLAATVLPDGSASVQAIALPFEGSTARTVAARHDLLVVGRNFGMTIYRLIDGVWTVEQNLTGTANATERLAITVGGDGVERIAASQTNLAQGGGSATPVRIYSRDPNASPPWVFEATLPTTSTGAFGADLALDGDRLVVGVPTFSSISQVSPATEVRTYVRSASAWIAEETLTLDNGPVVLGGAIGLPSGIGHRVALAHDTLVAMNASGQALHNTFSTGVVNQQTNLVVYRRTDGGMGEQWQQTDVVRSPSTRFGMGYELVAHEDGDDVVVIATVYRGFAPVIDGLIRFRIRSGEVIEETPIALPWSDDPSLNATSYGVARPHGDATWIAVTVPKEPDSAIRMIELDTDRCRAATPGDLNGDGIVDGLDLGILLSQWGPCPERGTCLGDLNGDGVVDGLDLGILLGNWTGGA